MMEDLIQVAQHGKQALYWYSLTKMSIEKQNETADGLPAKSSRERANLSRGFFQRFLGGKYVVLFQVGGIWKIDVCGAVYVLSDPELLIKCHRRFGLSRMLISYGRVTQSFWELHLFGSVSGMIDPTYDSLERENDEFFYQVCSLRKCVLEGIPW